MSKGGLAPRRKGDQFEVAVCQDMEKMGWETWRVRQAGGENVDIVAIQACQNGYSDHNRGMPHVQLIQCKVNRTSMTKAEKEALKLRAENINAVAVLAFKEKHVRYEVIRD